MNSRYSREIFITRTSIFASTVIFLWLYATLGIAGWDAASAGNWHGVGAIAAFALVMLFVAYGNYVYQICLAGYYKRMRAFSPAPRHELEAIYDLPAPPTLAVIIPSYKEEYMVNWQTMMSAAFAEYPAKSVVLLIDDPRNPRTLEDITKLDKNRELPATLQALFDAPRARYEAERAAFNARIREGKLHAGLELGRLAYFYDEVAAWAEGIAALMAEGRPTQQLNHVERFFTDAVALSAAQGHRARAEELRAEIRRGSKVNLAELGRHYTRLVALFDVRFSSFERKKYANLSHEANKAMNLNSYIALVGRSWKEEQTPAGLMLRQCGAEEATFTIPHADYINTIDADSMMLPDYAIKLVQLMEKPGNERLAVVQSTVSSYPGAPGAVEHTAGAGIDVQFKSHQGYTHWDATFWVGANAMLRRTALEEIRETHIHNGHPVSVYIQDRTVIEDTESTIDLVEKGWKLHNYPERLTFSANPPDFGSLLIQRRRWSNGGMIILPKLLSYARRTRKMTSLRNAGLAREMFMRFHYLASTTTGCLAALVLMLYPFDDHVPTDLVPLTVLPLLALFTWDLTKTGYRASDMLRICALNLMLMPVAMGGVAKQFQQMVTGVKIPFGRTPKVAGRTAAPAFYCLMEVAMFFGFAGMFVHAVSIGCWQSAIFGIINTMFMGYALVKLIGLRALAEDISASAITLWKQCFHHAEIIQLPVRRFPLPRAVLRRRAS